MHSRSSCDDYIPILIITILPLSFETSLRTYYCFLSSPVSSVLSENSPRVNLTVEAERIHGAVILCATLKTVGQKRKHTLAITPSLQPARHAVLAVSLHRERMILADVRVVQLLGLGSGISIRHTCRLRGGG